MSPNVPESVLEQIKASLREGQKIAAIKRLHEATGMGLAEAKAAVENLHAELHAKDPASYPASSTPGAKGCLGVVIALIFIAGVVLGILLLRR